MTDFGNRPPSDGSPASASGAGSTAERPLPPELDPRRPAPPRRTWGRGRTRNWNRKRMLGVAGGGMVLVLLLVVGLGYLAINSILGAVHKASCQSCVEPIGGKGLNILIIGSDSRAGLTTAQKKEFHVGSDSGQRSDTMILLHIPANGGKADMVSLPRDSYVTIPAHCSNGTPPKNGKCAGNGSVTRAAPNKLNAAFSFGGANLTVSTVEANTKVPINHYIIISFAGFVNMVDKLGGVPICNPKAISDPIHLDPSTGVHVGSGLELPAGTSTLHGPQALEYVRAREFDPSQGDLGRIQRQQKFMGAMLNKAESAGVLLNLPKLFGFLKTVASSLTVDSQLSRGEMFSLARKLHGLSPKNVNLLTVPLSNTAYSTSVGSAVLWDPVLSKRLFHDLAADNPIANVAKPQKLTVPPSTISLQVLNATKTNGLATHVGQALSAVGFSVSHTGNAPRGSNPATTVVLYGPSRSDSAKTVAAAVPGAVMKQDSSLGSGIELVVGSNYARVKAVKVASATSDRPAVRTGASNPCT